MSVSIIGPATDLPREDYRALRDALLAWKAEGIASPIIPHDIDVDGDGIVDGFGLDDADELVYVKGVPLEETVAQSTGGGVETDREAVDSDG
ncbi:hypothetical protein [Microbacterium sp.]|uniref:hypothetical protein n=1 Tax=Microbacterium sp. TaxID=51671 RepID=UPI003F708E72